MPDLTFLKDLVSNTYFKIAAIAIAAFVVLSLISDCGDPQVATNVTTTEETTEALPAVNITAEDNTNVTEDNTEEAAENSDMEIVVTPN